MGRQAGEIANAQLAGVAPAALRLPALMPPTANVDWRQVRRWGIDANAIPGDAVVRFKAPTFLEQHRNEVIGAVAVLLLQTSGADRREELRAILADIRRDDLRASEVIRRLRALLAKQAVEWQPFDLNNAVREVESLLLAEARRRGVALDVRPAATAVWLVGDRIQIQQVLINLILNALDAVADLAEARRTVIVAVAHDAAQRAARAEAERLRAAFAALTSRERAVFDRIVAGKLNKQIADQLGVAERTVKMQRAQLMAKLGVNSAAELGRLAERLQRLPD